MNQGFIKVAAGTPQVTVADCKANTRAILEVIREMETQHAKLMVLPELCITGYTCQDLFLQRRLLDSAWESLLTIAEETLCFRGGCVDRCDSWGGKRTFCQQSDFLM